VSSAVNHVPAVSVVLPCRNEAAHIEDCLRSILGQEEPKAGFEVIIADGMSDDGTREVLARLEHEGRRQKEEGRRKPTPTLRVIENPGRIVSTGLNAAIRAARGGIIVRMDAHTEYAQDYVLRCVEVLEGTKADNVGGPWVAKGDGYMSRAVAAAFQSPFAVGGARGHDPNHEGGVDTVYLGCWRKETFERFGYFDEELVRNQDDEHNLRIIRGGGRIWQSPEIRSWYHPRGSLRALFKQYMQYGYWKVRVIQKHKLPASIRHLVPGAFVLVMMVLFLLSVVSFLLSAFAPNSQLSPLSIPISIFSFPLSIFSFPFSAFRFPVSGFSFPVSAFSFSFPAALASYGLAVLVASVLTARKTEWKLLPVLPLVFPCYHIGYGIGFLRGIWDFVILGRGASPSFTNLTRESPEAKPAPRRS